MDLARQSCACECDIFKIPSSDNATRHRPADTSPGTDRPPRRRRSTGVDGDALSLWQAAAIAIVVIVAIVVASGGVLSTAAGCFCSSRGGGGGSGWAPVRGLLGEGAAGAQIS